MNLSLQTLAIAADCVRYRIDNTAPAFTSDKTPAWTHALAEVRAAIAAANLAEMGDDELIDELADARWELADAAVVAVQTGDFVQALDEQARRYSAAQAESQRRTALDAVVEDDEDDPEWEPLTTVHVAGETWVLGEQVKHRYFQRVGTVVGGDLRAVSVDGGYLLVSLRDSPPGSTARWAPSRVDRL